MLSVTWALIIEVYREYGVKFQEAIEELHQKLDDPAASEQRKPRAPDNQQSMAMLQAMMGDSDFRGPKG